MYIHRGFTLIELMVTLAVLAIVLAVAIPSFNSQIQNNRSLAIGEDFATALNFARSEAVKRGSPVVLCASNAAQTGCANDWTNGWLVATDTALATASSPVVGAVLRVWMAPSDAASITVESADSAVGVGSAVGFIRYIGTGVLARVNNDPKIMRITAYSSGCTGRGKQKITVGVAGSLSVAKEDC